LEIFEHWVSKFKAIKSEDFFALIDKKAFIFLYGEGEWIIFAKDPVHILDDFSEKISFVRSGDIPKIKPDILGFITYEYGYNFDRYYPFVPKLLLPGFSFAVYKEIYLYNTRLNKLYIGKREMKSLGILNSLGEGEFSAEKEFDTDTKTSYCEKVDYIREQIKAGEVYQVNLTRQECWKFKGNLIEFAKSLSVNNFAPYSAFFSSENCTVISSSPEKYIRIRGDIIRSYPIKGTVKRGVSKEEDERLKSFLTGSKKNIAELAMITDLIRNDLGIVCQVGTIKVDRFKSLESFSNVHHLVSEISGRLKKDISLRNILKATFPGGSITGCPKIPSVNIISKLEELPRNIYTGSIGWYSCDLQTLDFNIAIRTCYAVGNKLYFGVGGGIIWDSEPVDEYLETVYKGSSIVKCLKGS
jgi:para-aminobenzoate synthetase component 1